MREVSLSRRGEALPPSALTAFFALSPLPSVVVDAEGWILTVNDAFLALAPWSAPGTNFLDAHVGSSRARLQVALLSPHADRVPTAELRASTGSRAGPRLEYRFFLLSSRGIGVIGVERGDDGSRGRVAGAPASAARAVRDPRTGLWTHEQFLVLLESALASGAEHGVELSCIALRIDGLERIRRKEGDGAAAALRRALARRLHGLLRDYPSLTAYGDDRFAFFVTPCGPDRAERIGRQVAAEISVTRFSVCGAVHRVSARIGRASGRGGDRTAEAVLSEADGQLARRS